LVLLGNGDGTFQKPVSTGAVDESGEIAVADFNGDGNPDFAIGPDLYASAAQVFLGNGNGTFQPPINVTLPNATSTFVVGDFTGDGIPDLVVPTLSGTQVFIGEGNGTFTAGPITAFQGYNYAVGDLNGDGRLDLFFPDSTSVLLGNGDGTFQVPAAFYQGNGDRAILGRFRTSGPLDAVTGGLYYRNTGRGTFDDPRTYSAPFTGPEYIDAIESGIFTGSGKMDLVISSGPYTAIPTVAVFPGYGNGNLGPPIETSLGSAFENLFPGALLTGDFNHDGNLDLILNLYNEDTEENSMAVLLGNGHGSFAAPLVTPDVYALVVADFNNDGIPDVAVSVPDGVEILLGNGNGTFTLKSTLPFLAYSQTIAVDLNGDGNQDLVSPPAVWLGKGDGTFRQAPALNTSSGYTVSADFNSDGKPDLAIIVGCCELWVMLGNGNGTFGAPTEYAAGGGANPLHAADFNGDGIPDLSLGTFLYLGKGNGAFSLATTNLVVTTDSSGLLTVADFNGDGKPDFGLVFANSIMTTINTTK